MRVEKVVVEINNLWFEILSSGDYLIILDYRFDQKEGSKSLGKDKILENLAKHLLGDDFINKPDEFLMLGEIVELMW